MSGRDYQKSKVYRWENEIIGPKGGARIMYDDAQTFINAVWMANGLLYPPKVVPMPRQNRRYIARANRFSVWLKPGQSTPTWIILHELAHSMTGDESESDHHREDFLGVYMKLVDRHLKIPLPLLMFTANKAGLKFNLAAQPRCLDEHSSSGP